MLLYEETKAFEKAIGPEATELLAKVFERHDYAAREGLATREDLLGVRTELKEEISSVRTELKEEISSVRNDLKTEIKDLEIRLNARISDNIKWIAGLLVAQAAAITALVKLL